MKLLVLSDSHGERGSMTRAVELEKPDYVIHLGDCVDDAQWLSREYPMLPLANVRGNCDFGDMTQELRLAEYGGVRVLMSHGHRYQVKSGLLRYSLAARENQVDVALFGHTHQAYCEEWDGLWLVNPGSCRSYPIPTYAIVQIEGGKAACRICRLDDKE